MHGKCTRHRVKGIPGVKDRSFDTLQDAKTWLAQAQTDARRGEFVDPRDGAISLRDYTETHWWPTRSGDPSTIERTEQQVRRHILPHLGSQPLNGIGAEGLRNWKKRLEKDLGPASIRLVWATLSSILQTAVEDRRLARNPCRSSTVGPPTAGQGRVEAWSPERVLAVRAAMPERYRVLVELGAGLGLRQGEALGLSVEDVDFDKEVVHVRRQVKMVRAKLCFALPKGRKVRDVPLPSSVARAVQRHTERFAPVPVTLPWDDPRPPETPVEAKHRRPRTYSLLVTGRERKAINRNYFNSHVWKPVLTKAGVIAPLEESTGGSRVWEPSREHGFHALRHFYASEELEAGESVVSLARWLGHSDPGFTLRKYSHFLPRAGARGSAAIDAIFA
ncbi:tyrosine-type recombinase/integrase [Streptomyces sp. TRM 70361]|uniref:tyrosine-type recombinase/integrase n=1 Tax=Streptomyces sp. TRM 70361 TaxID=3116553 RepID=UPI002E7C03D8|nr:tyrosine-type recombinase/integrase [Streptomyces sp. TRM 70361]MEE1942528.1 tyrosine-type recombinase/integrase [Streptomyces sp. TRM 70361]